MKPPAAPLRDALDAVAASADPVHVAYAHNFLFEERLGPDRQQAYERDYAPADGALAAWKESHRRYLFAQVWVGRGDEPVTFSLHNQKAIVPELAGEQILVRAENIDWALAAAGLDLAFLSTQLEAWRTAPDGAEGQDARAVLADFCDTWNNYVRGQDRPAFVAFKDEIEAEIAVVDWPHQVRDRLGLSHYNPVTPASPVPVALMSYRVGEVLASVAPARKARTFALPTALDGDLNAHFFPAPAAAGYGRSLDLAPDPNCERLVAELVHTRIEYTPEHILKLGFVSRRIPPHAVGDAFAKLRNGHLFCLRYEAGRADYGAEIPESGHA